jgi:hypothetical protein
MVPNPRKLTFFAAHRAGKSLISRSAFARRSLQAKKTEKDEFKDESSSPRGPPFRSATLPRCRDQVPLQHTLTLMCSDIVAKPCMVRRDSNRSLQLNLKERV